MTYETCVGRLRSLPELGNGIHELDILELCDSPPESDLVLWFETSTQFAIVVGEIEQQHRYPLCASQEGYFRERIGRYLVDPVAGKLVSRNPVPLDLLAG